MKEEKKEGMPRHVNQTNKSDVDYKKDQANGNLGDPSSKRNIGLNGGTQRDNQKDELGNLSIKGDEVSGYGKNNHTGSGENAAGPGFEAEGSEYADDVPNRDSD